MLARQKIMWRPNPSKSWRETSLQDVHRLDFRKFEDSRGALSLLDNARGQLGFNFDRCFMLSDVPATDCRANHANRLTTEVIFAIGGPLTVQIHDGDREESCTLAPLDQALVVPPGLWLKLKDFTADTVCVVLASGRFEEDTQMKSFEQFAKAKKAADHAYSLS